MPVGARYSRQERERIDKDEHGGTSTRHVHGVVFVPLIDDAPVVPR